MPIPQPRRRLRSPSRRAVVRALWAVVLASLGGQVSGIAHAAEQNVELSAGALIGLGTEELGGTPYVSAAYQRLWDPFARLGIGVRLRLGAAVIPYGNADGEPVVGERSGYDPTHLVSDPTLIPGVALALRLHCGQALSITADLGFSFLVSSEMGPHGIFPIPTTGLAATVAITPSLAVRVNVSALWLYGEDQLLTPTAGLVWTL